MTAALSFQIMAMTRDRGRRRRDHGLIDYSMRILRVCHVCSMVTKRKLFSFMF